MKILIVEPSYRRAFKTPSDGHEHISNNKNKTTKLDDEKLWYPPLGLLKLARFHKIRGDEVRFLSGCDESIIIEPNSLTCGLHGTGFISQPCLPLISIKLLKQ